MKSNKLLVVAIIITLAVSLFGEDWPVIEFNAQHNVVGNLGEYRIPSEAYPNGRFHRGIDITNADHNVYSIVGGTVTYIGNENTTDEFIHITGTDGSEIEYFHVNSLVAWDEVIATNQLLGSMVTQTSIHVHIQEMNNNYLNLFNPYTDDAVPVILDTSFRENGHTLLNEEPLYNNVIQIEDIDYYMLYQKVDLIMDAYDPGTAEDGSGNNARMAPYKISYEIFDEWDDDDPISTWNSIDNGPVANLLFEDRPNNLAAPHCFGYGTTQVPPVYNFILTSHPYTEQFDRYFNTIRRDNTEEEWTQNENYDARCNSEAHYRDGIYRIEYRAYDADYDNNPNNVNIDNDHSRKNILIDNFYPYIEKVEVLSGGESVYFAEWVWDGSVIKLLPESPEEKMRGIAQVEKDLSIIVTSSESLSELFVTFNPSLNWIGSGISLNDEKTEWGFVITEDYLDDYGSNNGEHQIRFSGEDLAGNDIQGFSNPVSINQVLTRVDENNWSYEPIEGYDMVHEFIIGGYSGTILVKDIQDNNILNPGIQPGENDKYILEDIDNAHENFNFVRSGYTQSVDNEVIDLVPDTGWAQISFTEDLTDVYSFRINPHDSCPWFDIEHFVGTSVTGWGSGSGNYLYGSNYIIRAQVTSVELYEGGPSYLVHVDSPLSFPYHTYIVGFAKNKYRTIIELDENSSSRYDDYTGMLLKIGNEEHRISGYGENHKVYIDNDLPFPEHLNYSSGEYEIYKSIIRKPIKSGFAGEIDNINNTVKLYSGSEVNDFYTDMTLRLSSAHRGDATWGNNEEHIITGYDGNTKIATVDGTPTWQRIDNINPTYYVYDNIDDDDITYFNTFSGFEIHTDVTDIEAGDRIVLNEADEKYYVWNESEWEMIEETPVSVDPEVVDEEVISGVTDYQTITIENESRNRGDLEYEIYFNELTTMPCEIPILFDDLEEPTLNVDLDYFKAVSTVDKIKIEMGFFTDIDPLNFIGTIILDIDQNSDHDYIIHYTDMNQNYVDMADDEENHISSYPVEIDFDLNVMSFSIPLVDIGKDEGILNYKGFVCDDVANYENRDILTENNTWVTINSNSWLSVSPLSGNISAGLSEDLTLTIDATNLNNGTYSANMIIANSNIYEPEIIIPINIEVTGSQYVPPANFNVTVDGYNAALTWDIPGSESAQRIKQTNNETNNSSRLNRNITGYNIYRNNEIITQIIDPVTVSYSDVDLDNDSYVYFMTSVYENDESGPSDTQNISIEIYSPTNLIAQINNGNDVSLSWEANNLRENSENSFKRSNKSPLNLERQFEIYRLYRNNELIIETQDLSYDDIDVLDGTYMYSVTAVYTGGFESEHCLASTPTIIAPAPENLTAEIINHNDIYLMWDSPNLAIRSKQSNRSFETYRIYRDGSMINETMDLTYTDVGVQDGEYIYSVTAVYTDIESEPCVIEQSIQMAPPPINLTALVVDNIDVDLTWESTSLLERLHSSSANSSDIETGEMDRSFVTYKVFRNGAMLYETTDLFYTDVAVPYGDHLYYVTAVYDEVESEPCITNGMVTIVAHPPTNLIAEIVNLNDVDLVWDEPVSRLISGFKEYNEPNRDSSKSRESRSLTGYNVYRNNILLGNIPMTVEAYTDEDVPDGIHIYSVKAVYTGDIESESCESDPVTIAPPPTNLTAVIEYYNNVNLNWDALNSRGVSYSNKPHKVSWNSSKSRESRDLIGYNVYRNGVLVNSTPIVDTEFDDQTLPDGNYSYYVKAVYDDGLISEPSNTVDNVVVIPTGTWTISGSPYIINGDATIPDQQTLNINQSVEVRFLEDASLIINGSLNAIGADENEILFTSNSISDYEGLLFEDAGISNLTYCIIECADIGINIVDTSSDIILSNNIIQENTQGIWIYNSNLEMTFNLIINNDNNGIAFFNNANFRCKKNVLNSNGGYEIFLSNSRPSFRKALNDFWYDTGFTICTTTEYNPPVDMILNWWGTDNVQYINANLLDSATMYDIEPISLTQNSTYTPRDLDLSLLLYESGRNEMRVGNYIEAESIFKELVLTYPHCDEISTVLSSLLSCYELGFGDFNLLQNYYETIQPDYPNDPEHKILRGLITMCKRKVGNFEEAIADYESILMNDPSYVDSCYAVIDIGNTYLEAGYNRESIETVLGDLRPISKSRHREVSISLLESVLSYEYQFNDPPEINETYLKQNFPNPFNPETRIKFDLAKTSNVNLIIYNIKGQLLKTLVNESFESGSHSVIWDGKDNKGNSVSSGVYFYQLKVNNKTEGIKKMLLLK